MRAMPTEGVLRIRRAYFGRTHRRMDTRATALCGAAASRCHRRQHSSHFPSFARTVSAWLWVVREHIRMRVHVPLDVTLAQSSSIARQLAATGASRGSSRSSSKAGPLVVQHPRPRQIHVFIHTSSSLCYDPFPPSFRPSPAATCSTNHLARSLRPSLLQFSLLIESPPVIRRVVPVGWTLAHVQIALGWTARVPRRSDSRV